MICPPCHGKGWVLQQLVTSKPELDWIPCPFCGGTGSLHCCEGEQAQPEKDAEERKCRS